MAYSSPSAIDPASLGTFDDFRKSSLPRLSNFQDILPEIAPKKIGKMDHGLLFCKYSE
jgi:hypothetical protein